MQTAANLTRFNEGLQRFARWRGRQYHLGIVERARLKTGSFEWQTADPRRDAVDMGAVSVANGVVYAASFSGSFYAIHAKTCKVLWSFASGGSVIDGPSLAERVVYWGSGYSHIPPGKPNNKVFAFTVPYRNRQRGAIQGDSPGEWLRPGMKS